MQIDDIDRLVADNNPGYLPRAIPDALDTEIETLLTPVLGGGWSELRSHVAPEHHAVLRLFGERMASLAVRRRRSDLLELALVALAVGGLDTDSREALAIVPLVYRSAEILGNDPGALFESVAGRVGEKAGEALRAFLRRDNRSIAQMGYEESTDEDGFRYRRTW